MTSLSTVLDGARVLVTGGTGFIGRHLTRRCVQLGAKVTALSLTEKPGNRPDGVTVVQADLRRSDWVARALGGTAFDFVFNLGGYINHTPYLAGGRDVIDQHLTGLMNLIDALDRSALRGFVQVGSSDEYGDLPAPQSGVSVSAPISPYAFAKRAGSDLVRSLATRESFPGTVACVFLAYGPGQAKSRLLPQVILACLENETFAVSPGEQTRDFCFVEDVVEGLIMAAASTRARGSVVNIASGEPLRIRDVVESVVRLTGTGRPEFGARPYRQGESMELFADISKTRELLGWRPQTSLEQGLALTIASYRES